MLKIKNNQKPCKDGDLGSDETKARELDLMLDIIKCEKDISESLNERFGSGASEQAYSIQHCSLAGTKVESIELDIHPFIKI